MRNARLAVFLRKSKIPSKNGKNNVLLSKPPFGTNNPKNLFRKNAEL
jgi:hypothetical protein